MTVCLRFFLILFFCTHYLTAQSAIEAKIEVVNVENMISLKAYARSNDNIVRDLNYLLLSIKQGENKNLSNQKQEGKFVIQPYERNLLSEMRINLNPSEELKAYLFIRDNEKNELYSKDSIYIKFDGNRYSFEENKIQEPLIKKEEFVLTGIVVDQTKTKAGKDFFDKFYSTYNLRNEKYPFIATVNELPEFGRSSFIQIEENEKILYKFRAIPNEEYIEQQVEITLKILNQYQSERQLLQRELSAP